MGKFWGLLIARVFLVLSCLFIVVFFMDKCEIIKLLFFFLVINIL